MIVFIAYQMMFAIITPALITGAFANRVTFKAYMLFLTGWLLLVYFPFVHMIWGGGMLEQWGVLDFAGGIVVHNIAGIAALASVLYVGKRRVADSGRTASRSSRSAPGCSGSAGTASTPAASSGSTTVTAVAFLNTDLAASFAAIAWLCDRVVVRTASRSFLGLLTGAVAGLATITPAAGYVSPAAAVLIGIVAGRRLLLRRRAQEPAAVGRRARRLGRARRGRLPRDRAARRLRRNCDEPGRRARV